MDCLNFQDLALVPLCYTSFNIAQEALKKARLRYPATLWLEEARDSLCQPAENSVDIETAGLGIGDEWGLRIQTIIMFPENSYAEWLKSLAKGSTVKDELVIEYLHFLRQRKLKEDYKIRISNVRYVKEEVLDLRSEGLELATIIPVRDKYSWSFVVAYPDCIHHYHSRLSTPLTISAGTRAVYSSGPRGQNKEESAIYTLLGIRCIQEGKTHLSQEAAENIQPFFRYRMTIELVCEQIDPDDTKVRSGEIRNRHSFVDNESLLALESLSEPPEDALESLPEPSEDAIIDWGEDRRSNEIPDFVVTSPGFGTPTPTLSPTSTRRSTAESHITSNSPLTSSQSRSRSSAGRSIRNSLIPRVEHNPIFINERKGILDILCTAISVYRSTEASESTTLLVLWHLMKKRSTKNLHFASQFHERYNAVLFREKMRSLNDNDDELRSQMKYQADGSCISKMKKVSSQCKFWENLCKIGYEKWGTDVCKYVLLLAIPALSPDKIQRHGEHILSQLKDRLKDNADPLGSWLLSAQALCEGIIKRTLSKETLMIDLYHLKAVEDIDDNTYAAFVSLDPHTTIELPRVLE